MGESKTTFCPNNTARSAQNVNQTLFAPECTKGGMRRGKGSCDTLSRGHFGKNMFVYCSIIRGIRPKPTISHYLSTTLLSAASDLNQPYHTISAPICYTPNSLAHVYAQQAYKHRTRDCCPGCHTHHAHIHRTNTTHTPFLESTTMPISNQPLI